MSTTFATHLLGKNFSPSPLPDSPLGPLLHVREVLLRGIEGLLLPLLPLFFLLLLSHDLLELGPPREARLLHGRVQASVAVPAALHPVKPRHNLLALLPATAPVAAFRRRALPVHPSEQAFSPPPESKRKRHARKRRREVGLRT